MPLSWLWALVLAEVVGHLVAEGQQVEPLAGALGLARVEVLDGTAQLEQGLPDLAALGGPHSSNARTGRSSIRLEVSAALRMSASPIVRTLSACAASSGLLTCAAVRAAMKLSTLASSSGTASAQTCGAIRGAWVVDTCGGASGAVRVSEAFGASRGAAGAAAPAPWGGPGVW